VSEKEKLRKAKRATRDRFKRLWSRAAAGEFYRNWDGFEIAVKVPDCAYCRLWVHNCSRCPASLYPEIEDHCVELENKLQNAGGSPKKQVAFCEWVLEMNRRIKLEGPKDG
jgi:hypothetical protein